MFDLRRTAQEVAHHGAGRRKVGERYYGVLRLVIDMGHGVEPFLHQIGTYVSSCAQKIPCKRGNPVTPHLLVYQVKVTR